MLLTVVNIKDHDQYLYPSRLLFEKFSDLLAFNDYTYLPILKYFHQSFLSCSPWKNSTCKYFVQKNKILGYNVFLVFLKNDHKNSFSFSKKQFFTIRVLLLLIRWLNFFNEGKRNIIYDKRKACFKPVGREVMRIRCREQKPQDKYCQC